MACARVGRAVGTQLVACFGSRGVATYAIRSHPASSLDLSSGDAHLLFKPSASSLRSSTAAVATRLIKQEEVPLEPGTPTTLQAAMAEPSDQARVVTAAEVPHRIVFVNQAWERLCGYKASEVLGRPGLSFLQGPETDQYCKAKVGAAAKQATRARVALLNYKADGTPFLNRLQVSPLWSQRPGEVTHLLGVLHEIKHS